MYYIIYFYMVFSFLFSSNLYFDSDPFYLFYYENEQFDTNDYDVDLNIRPAFKSEYNDQMSLSYNAWYYYNDNAPNLENTSNRWVSRGSNLYNSVHFDYFNKYLYFSIEPYFFTSENLTFNPQHTDPLFQALNDGMAHTDKPYVSYGLRETQLVFHQKGFGIGLSNTNMWWGPGIHNSLHMSNNTSGFDYFFLGTTSEKKIKSFGYNLKYVFSKLDKNEAQPYYTGVAADITYYSDPIITLGFFRSFLSGGNRSDDNVSMFDAMILPFEGFFKKTLFDQVDGDPTDDADQTASAFVSVLFPESGFKLYLEYGWNDHRWDIYDFLQHYDHTSGSIIGFRKYGLFNKKELIMGFEYTNLVIPRYTRGGADWYNRNLFDYNLYDGRRFVAHSGADSDDILFYFGYMSNKDDIILSFNYERHGINKSINLSENDDLFNTFYVPEYKLEFKIDIRRKISFGEIYFLYEFEFFDNFNFPLQQIEPHNLESNPKKSNVFGIGFSKNIK